MFRTCMMIAVAVVVCGAILSAGAQSSSKNAPVEYFVFSADAQSTQSLTASDPAQSNQQMLKQGDRLHFRDVLVTIKNISADGEDALLTMFVESP